MTPAPIITLLTDYGTRDHYVACLKGVILTIAPRARIVDITHEIEPQQVGQGAFVLRQAWSWFPPGTIHVVVVDPGVGGERRIVLGRYDERFVIAPDNGLLTFVHRDFVAEAVHVLENRRLFLPSVSRTFHGRDIMAPVAAHLAGGVPPREVGRITDHLEMLPVLHRATGEGKVLRGSVLYVDRFGNMITNVAADQLDLLAPDRCTLRVEVGGELLGPVLRTFSDVAPGEPAALVGGTAMLEIVVNQGRAADRFPALGTGAIVVRG